MAIDNQQKYSVISDFLSLKGSAPLLESSYLLLSNNSGLKIWVQCTYRIEHVKIYYKMGIDKMIPWLIGHLETGPK